MKTPSLIYPLNEFYTQAKLPLPPATEVEALDVPEPYRSLLVHEVDMTSTLERFHGGRIRIRVHGRRRRKTDYFREVVLFLEETGQPVEFGAIRIDLGLLPPAVSRQILTEQFPLGRILNESNVAYSSQPKAFLRIASDKLINGWLGLAGLQLLFGRRNTLLDAEGRSIAEIVEILPPAPKHQPKPEMPEHA